MLYQAAAFTQLPTKSRELLYNPLSAGSRKGLPAPTRLNKTVAAAEDRLINIWTLSRSNNLIGWEKARFVVCQLDVMAHAFK
jgi:hypothetical protein